MKCSEHPETEAVGACVYCGSGVCDQCKVRQNDKVHCKKCIAAGRIKGFAEPQAGAPNAPASMGYPNYPATTDFYMTPGTFKSPKPTGTPSKSYFQFGMGASLACMVVNFIMAGMMSYFMWHVDDGPINNDHLLVIGLVVASFLYPVFIGLFGFYRNYGSSTVLKAVLAGLILLSIFEVIWSYYTFTIVNYNIGSSLSLYMPIFLGGAVLAIAVSLGFVMFYMLPFSEGRNTTKWALGMMVAAAISFLAMYGVIIVGWILLGAAMLLLAFVFMKAPMPGKSEAEELPPVPSIAQPIRH